MKQVLAEAGKRTKLLHLFSDSIAQTIRFGAAPVEGDTLPNGTVEVVMQPWLLGRVEQKHPLAAEQAFRKRLSDANYRIYVTADEAVRITFRSRHLEVSALIWIIAAVIAIAALSAIVVPMLR